MEFVEKRMWNYVYLNSGLTIKFNGQEFESKNGLLDLLQKELEAETIYPIGHYVGEHLQFAFTHTNAYGENYFSFVNGQCTSDGGTHLTAFKEGFIKGVNDFFQSNYKSEDIREGITAAILVKVKNPIFESQTKNKLGNTDIKRSSVRAGQFSSQESGDGGKAERKNRGEREAQDGLVRSQKAGERKRKKSEHKNSEARRLPLSS